MGALDLLAAARRFLFGSGGPGDSGVDESRIDALARAGDDSVTRPLLRNDQGYTARPPVAYLHEDETVEHVLHGSNLAIGTPGDDDAMVEQPSTRTLTFVTTERVLFVVGSRLSDSLWSIPYEGVTDASLRRDEDGHMLVVHADHEDDTRTFYANLALEQDTDYLRGVMRTIRENTPSTESRSGDESQNVDDAPAEEVSDADGPSTDETGDG